MNQLATFETHVVGVKGSTETKTLLGSWDGEKFVSFDKSQTTVRKREWINIISL